MKPVKTVPTDLELELLKVIWERGEATVREVFPGSAETAQDRIHHCADDDGRAGTQGAPAKEGRGARLCLRPDRAAG